MVKLRRWAIVFISIAAGLAGIHSVFTSELYAIEGIRRSSAGSLKRLDHFDLTHTFRAQDNDNGARTLTSLLLKPLLRSVHGPSHLNRYAQHKRYTPSTTARKLRTLQFIIQRISSRRTRLLRPSFRHCFPSSLFVTCSPGFLVLIQGTFSVTTLAQLRKRPA